MDARCAIELKAPGYDKGGAIAAFLVAAGVPRANADLCRRRYDRRKRVRPRRSARRPRLFRRQAAPRRDRPVRRAARGPRVARRIRPSRERRMTERRQTKSQNLDLALIGNQLLRRPRRPQRPHRVVVLSPFRFRSGVLAPARRRRGEGLLRCRACRPRRDRVALCAQHRDRRDDPHRRSWRQGAHLRFRAAVRAIRARVPAAADHPPHRAARRPAAHRDSRAADAQLRAADEEHRRRLQSHSLYRRRRRSCA